MMDYIIQFKSDPEMFKREKSGAKSNAVRAFIEANRAGCDMSHIGVVCLRCQKIFTTRILINGYQKKHDDKNN
jgi:hypothetical protein